MVLIVAYYVRYDHDHAAALNCSIYDIVATSLATFLPSDTGVMPVLDAYFAACKLKIMLAHTVLNYNVKMENEGVWPADYLLASSCIPNPKGRVMFCKRAT